MDLSIIISYYKSLDNLRLILQALNKQSNPDFEVIVSEDDFNESTQAFILKNQNNFCFPIIHIFQEKDNGFRKNQMLNRAVKVARTNKLAFIDGDCVPHRHFVKEYIWSIKKNTVCEGRAVLLSEKITNSIKQKGSIKKLNLINVLLSGSQKKKEGIYSPRIALNCNKKGRGIIGRNWGVCKQLLISVNGFDMDYIYAGVGEDVDIEWRLKQAKDVRYVSVKNKAIVYHLYHPRNYSETHVRFNYKVLENKQKDNFVYCKNGYDKIELYS